MFKRSTNARPGTLLLLVCTASLLSLGSSTALAQSMDHGSMDMDGMNMDRMGHGTMNMGDMDHGSMGMKGITMPSGHDAMKPDGMNLEAVDPRQRTDDTAKTFAVERMTYAATGEGGCQSPIQIDPTTGAPACWPQPMMDQATFGKVLIDQLELGYTDGADSYAWEIAAYWGDDFNKIRLETEGEAVQDGGVEAAEVQLLYSHLISPFFDIQAGLRYDLAPNPERAFLVLGLQGLAPYWFEVEADLYLGEDGRLSFRGELEYEVLLTQRLILTPSIEVTVAASDAPEYDLGHGLRSTETGLRLRYEIRRELAPYIGVTHKRLYGDTRALAHAQAGGLTLVMGVRIRF